ncbi:MAG: putative bifunctional diguanylate cyclase/phosphodiesterase [Bosea sp. (in: a-proteobacteria)]
MTRIIGSQLFTNIAALLIGAMIFVGGALWIGNATKARMLAADAIMAGQTWGKHLGSSIPDLEAVMEGAEPVAETREFLQRLQSIGHIFRYKLFDQTGTLRFVSDDQRWGHLDTRRLEEHNPFAAQVIRSGEPYLTARQGDGISRPKVFASAYLPLRLDGRAIGTLEVYVDHTERAQTLAKELIITGLQIGGLSTLAFFLPMSAFLWQSRLRRSAHNRLQHVASHDDLTGTLNRTAVHGAISRLIHENKRFALHFVDLDRFKDVNDSLGHATGDALLRKVTERLRDVVGENSAIGRLGGDEFAIVQILRVHGDAERLAQRIVNTVAIPYPLGDHDVQIGCSVGYSFSGINGSDTAELLKAADTALYAAKNSGRGRAVAYDVEMEEQRRARLALESCLRTAVVSNDFELHYQPLYETDGVSLRGFEALLRMRDQDGNPVSPSIFIPLAEEMGLIERIGGWVLKEACTTAALWPEDLTVAVNLSPLQFAGEPIVEVVSRCLAETGLPAGRLELEVTESVLLEHPESVIADLTALKALGVSIALDDFGTGYSSLSYLWRFPFDKLKVDRSFMSGLSDHGSKSREVLKTIIALGRVLELEITAEGVETDAQIDLLRQMDCDYVQGFLFGRPMPSTEVAATILRAALNNLPASASVPAASTALTAVAR